MLALAMDCFLAGIAILLLTYAVSWVWHKGANALNVRRTDLAIALFGICIGVFLLTNVVFDLCVVWSMWE